MVLRNWIVILCLAAVGLALGWYWLSTRPDPDVVTLGDSETMVSAIAALAGAVTTLAAAVSGAAMKLVEYRTASLEVKSAELELETKRRALKDE